MSGSLPSRIAIRAPNWLGDVVLSLPAVRDIRRAFPNAKISVVARPSVAPVYEAVPEIDAVLEVRGMRAEIAALRAGFDLAILLPNSMGTAFLAAVAGVPE
ncbi:MAG: lipopolysaccharide heptosyltransferase II, partial [Vicinamibacteria bacterium]